ncbi:TlpA family protein disulfide reductase [Chitinophaga defluvii]|uniref:TlpA disulfide reductase family protein n=1 Tax=Chitinophaga defluvii TaxID=3163343 RepID=A0ABV2T0H0_9BACT
MKNNKFSLSNIITALLVGLLLLMLFKPEAKAWLIQGLMKIGLFQPSVSTAPAAANATSLYTADIRFTGTDGREIKLSDLQGKIVFINFWATWCPPCIAEMPSVNALYEQFKDNSQIVFLTVDADAKPDKAQQFLDKNNYTLPLFTIASSIPASVYSGTLPTTVIIDKKGVVVFKHTGAADYTNKKLVQFITDLSTAAP